VTGGPAGVGVRRVDDAGVHLQVDEDSPDAVLDVLFDGRRIWSFHAWRDTAPDDGGGRAVGWPGAMARHLRGRARVAVCDHVRGDVLLDADLAFGDGDGDVAFVNRQGAPLAIDNSGRLQPTFDTRSRDQVAPLLDSVEVVLGALAEAGVEAFPAYGTLLGAVRDGALIGHDSDADLGYVSTHHDPVDVIRESFTLQRRLAQAGYEVVRYSGAGFKVVVTEPDGFRRGLDVFGGYFDDDRLVLLGEVRTPFRREWVHPLGTTTLEGRTLPAPAAPEHLLEAMYGPGWSTPDPAFKFETPASTTTRLDQWFRGTVTHRADWDRRYQRTRFSRPRGKIAPLAREVARAEPDADLVVDLGCGRGKDARWLARRGFTVWGLDYSARAFAHLDDPQERAGLDLAFHPVNLLELRHALAWGARAGSHPGHTVVMAHHLLDAMPPRGREHAWRFLALACRGGGRSHLQFLTAAEDYDPWVARRQLTPVDEAAATAAITAAGGRVVRRRELDAVAAGEDPTHPHADGRRLCRMVVEWT